MGIAFEGALSSRDFAIIRKVVAREVGIDLPDSKRPLVVARLAPRLRQLGLTSFDQYVERLETPFERAELVERITTHETRFFRDIEQYEFLAEYIERARAQAAGPLRIWCAACSSGEEPYSLVMQTLARNGSDAAAVLGTDVSRRVLERARSGIYPLDRLADVPSPLRAAYLLRGVGAQDGTFRVSAEVRGRVRFEPFNLVRDPAAALARLLPPGIGKAGTFDVILLRNVVFYFDQETRERVIATVSAALNEGGLLVLGRAEASIPPARRYRLVGPGSYRKEAA